MLVRKRSIGYLTKENPSMIDRVFEVRPKILPSPVITAPPRPSVPEIRDHIELLRICSSRRQLYFSRYKIDRGQLIYSCSVQVNELTKHMIYGQRFHDGIEVSDSQLGYETCPWCGTTRHGTIHCKTCENFMCGGLTYWRGSDQFIVCVGCNEEGKIVPETNTQVGIFPKVR
jgi:hypothetical protein